MEELRLVLQDIMNIDLIQVTMSQARGTQDLTKIKIRPMLRREQLFFQAEEFRNHQVFHQNLDVDQVRAYVLEKMENCFKQLQAETKLESVSVLVSKKGRVTVKRQRLKQAKEQGDLSHNRKKQYVLPEGTAVPFLVDLGVMTREGNVVKSKYDKYRQINRFLEFIRDVLPELPKGRQLTILDFGCGKSYLTFAMYYYLKELEGYDIRIIGLDLKKDVIDHCNQLSRRYGYDKLDFLTGDIADYEGVSEVDLVVTLHACDTATDFALAKAVRWNAKVILSVPCCQHELNGQMGSDVLEPLFRYGIIKERIAALATDALRAELLEQQGYRVQILEFIDMEHTPKNLLIRAVKTRKMENSPERYEACRDFLGVHPSLERLLCEQSEVKGKIK
ncbi:SAM-dependent methyltransferase [Diplocloster hominis]|uniref:class I SAM-dependent methyltransferase n=1 Tax=Diplocloster hominis TaxID=3079010 RepID=UPI0031BBC68F